MGGQAVPLITAAISSWGLPLSPTAASFNESTGRNIDRPKSATDIDLPGVRHSPWHDGNSIPTTDFPGLHPHAQSHRALHPSDGNGVAIITPHFRGGHSLGHLSQTQQGMRSISNIDNAPLYNRLHDVPDSAGNGSGASHDGPLQSAPESHS